MAKCLTCNSCLDPVWVGNNRWLHCWLEDKYYDVPLGSKVVVEISKDIIFPKPKLEQPLVAVEEVVTTVPEVNITIQTPSTFSGEIDLTGIPVDVEEVKVTVLPETDKVDVPIIKKKKRF